MVILTPGLSFRKPEWGVIFAILGSAALTQEHSFAIKGMTRELLLVACLIFGFHAGSRGFRVTVPVIMGLVACWISLGGEFHLGLEAYPHWFDGDPGGRFRFGSLLGNPNTLGLLGVFFGATFIRDHVIKRGGRITECRGTPMQENPGGMSIRETGRRDFPPGWTDVLGISAAAVLSALSLSRMATVGWTLACVLPLVLCPKRLSRPMVLLLAILPFLLWFHPWHWQRVVEGASLRAGTVSHRIFIWETGWRMFREHPLRGMGPGVVPLLFSAFRPPGRPETWALLANPGRLHNDLLEWLVEHGILLFLVGFWGLLRGPGKCLLSASPGGMPSILPLLGLVPGILTQGIFHGSSAGFFLAFCLGCMSGEQLLARRESCGTSPGVDESPVAVPWAKGMFALALALFLWQEIILSMVVQAEEKLRQGDAKSALSISRRAQMLAPWLSSPHGVEGRCWLAEALRTSPPWKSPPGIHGPSPTLSEERRFPREALLEKASRSLLRARERFPLDPDLDADLAEIERRRASRNTHLPGPDIPAMASAYLAAISKDWYRPAFHARLGELLLILGEIHRGEQEIACAIDLYDRSISIALRRGLEREEQTVLFQAEKADLEMLRRRREGSTPLFLRVTPALFAPENQNSLRLAFPSEGGNVPRLLVEPRILALDPDAVQRLASDSGFPTFVCFTPREALELGPSGLPAVQHAQPALAITSEEVEGGSIRWGRIAEAGSILQSSQGASPSLLLWKVDCSSDRISRANDLGFTDQVGLNPLVTRGLIPRTFQWERDWPGMLAHRSPRSRPGASGIGLSSFGELPVSVDSPDEVQ